MRKVHVFVADARQSKVFMSGEIHAKIGNDTASLGNESLHAWCAGGLDLYMTEHRPGPPCVVLLP